MVGTGVSRRRPATLFTGGNRRFHPGIRPPAREKCFAILDEEVGKGGWDAEVVRVLKAHIEESPE